jgi:surfactin synthase thioesterase subunit
MRASFGAGIVWPAPRPQARQVLVCLGFCGGGTAPFRPWSRVLGEAVDLALVCYPGREQRMVERPAQRWGELMQDTLASVHAVAHRPYVLFGHSMGAWVAFEVAVRLEAAGMPPQALVVSASNAPSRAWQEQLRPPRSTASDEELLEWLGRVGQISELVIAEPELRQLALDLFRADKRAIESYRFEPGRAVRAPVQVLQGVEDAEIDDGDGGWPELAAGACRIDRLPGGHFYTPDIWATLPRHMAAVINPAPR